MQIIQEKVDLADSQAHFLRVAARCVAERLSSLPANGLDKAAGEFVTSGKVPKSVTLCHSTTANGVADLLAELSERAGHATCIIAALWIGRIHPADIVSIAQSQSGLNPKVLVLLDNNRFEREMEQVIAQCLSGVAVYRYGE